MTRPRVYHALPEGERGGRGGDETTSGLSRPRGFTDGRCSPGVRPPVFFAFVLVLLAGCAATDVPDAPRTDGLTPPSDEAPPSVSAPLLFPQGIIFRSPDGALVALDAAAPEVTLGPGGFDVQESILVQADNEDALRIVAPDGSERRVVARGLQQVARASLSPDGTQAVVQATEGGALDVFVVDLSTGAYRRLSAGAENDESPEWSRAGDAIAYSSFSPTEGIQLHVVTPTGDELARVQDAGAIHVAFSPDGARVLDPGRLRIVEVANGAIVADLHEAGLAGLRAAGYAPDTRFPGQANRGTFPLDGAFSPDGGSLVFDGAVEKDGAYGVVVATMRVDGSGFRIVAGPFPVDPATTNGLNYSELNPMWR